MNDSHKKPVVMANWETRTHSAATPTKARHLCNVKPRKVEDNGPDAIRVLSRAIFGYPKHHDVQGPTYLCQIEAIRLRDGCPYPLPGFRYLTVKNQLTSPSSSDGWTDQYWEYRKSKRSWIQVKNADWSTYALQIRGVWVTNLKETTQLSVGCKWSDDGEPHWFDIDYQIGVHEQAVIHARGLVNFIVDGQSAEIPRMVGRPRGGMLSMLTSGDMCRLYHDLDREYKSINLASPSKAQFCERLALHIGKQFVSDDTLDRRLSALNLQFPPH